VRVAHLLGSLQIGGKERAALRLARRGRKVGQDHQLVLFDLPFRSTDLDFDPGEVPVHFLPRGTGLDLRFAWRLGRLIDLAGIHVVHAHNDSALVYAAIASSWLSFRRAGLVATFHTWPSHPTPWARRLTRWASSRGETVAVSDELNGRLLQHRWVERCGTIWNGVELDVFSPQAVPAAWRQILGLPDDAFLVGHVARFDPIKRHIDLLAAARALHATAPKIVFVLVGRGPLLEAMRVEARDLVNIRFVPQVLDAASFMRAMDLIVLCSSHEAAPLVLLEALACAKPVLATAVGGIPSMLAPPSEPPCGVLVPPFEPASLATSIAALARDEARRRRLAELALARAQAFSFTREWETYSRLYTGVWHATRQPA
jgi:glycosyltransferase involved in cell wall biosynthesis